MVRDAIILAGGKGTRMLPANIYTPKETLPLIDTPLINHIILEAVGAGVDRVHLVLSKVKKGQLERFFDAESDFHEENVRPDLSRFSLSTKGIEAEILLHVQEFPGGVGHAISVVSNSIDGAFLVLLGDNLLLSKHHGPHEINPGNSSKASLELVRRFEETGLPCAGIISVPQSEIAKFGIVEIEGTRIIDLMEKPRESEAPSDLALCGRYLFDNRANEILELFPNSEFGEMQSIEVLRHYIENGGLESVKLEEYRMYDSGNPFSWLKSQIDHGLRRKDMADDLVDWLAKRLTKI